MDDRVFDQSSAVEWISGIESERAKVRDSYLYPRLRAWIDRVSPLEVLDIGAGQGVCSDKMDLAGRKYTGVEPSPFLLNRARELYSAPHRMFVEGSAYALPFAGSTFDAAFSVAVWHLLADLKRAAMELARVLRTNGHFLIVTANPGNYSAWMTPYTETKLDGRRLEGKVIQEGEVISQDVLYLHTLDEIVTPLRNAGLRVDKSETFRESRWASIEGMKGVTIRDLDPNSCEEIRLVAERMRQTLIDVLGQEKGGSIYTLERLVDRVLWHLDPKNTTARVILSENQDGRITGHAIARIERGEDGVSYGYFSTLFVESESRRQGIATALMSQVEGWFREKQIPKIVYNTAHDNAKLIDLFHKHGYCITHQESEMVQLTKPLEGPEK